MINKTMIVCIMGVWVFFSSPFSSKLSASSRFHVSFDGVLYDLHENDMPGVYDLDKYYAVYDSLDFFVSLTDCLNPCPGRFESQSFLLT